jgi:hypothetical protein
LNKREENLGKKKEEKEKENKDMYVLRLPWRGRERGTLNYSNDPEKYFSMHF